MFKSLILATTVGLALGQDAPNQQCSDDAGPGWDDVREYYREGSDYPVRSSDPAPASRPVPPTFVWICISSEPPPGPPHSPR